VAELTVAATGFIADPARAAAWVSQDGGATCAGGSTGST
jgi:hypothetical protein